jgi:hypothetical protein
MGQIERAAPAEEATELARVLTRLRKRHLESAAWVLLDGLGVLTLVAVLGPFCSEFLKNSRLLAGLSSQQTNFYAAGLWGIGILLLSLGFAFRERIRAVCEME